MPEEQKDTPERSDFRDAGQKFAAAVFHRGPYVPAPATHNNPVVTDAVGLAVRCYNWTGPNAYLPTALRQMASDLGALGLADKVADISYEVHPNGFRITVYYDAES